MIVPQIEKVIGIETYATSTPGIGGTIRRELDDFMVEEILVDGSMAHVASQTERQALGSSDIANRYLLCVLVKRNWDTLAVIKAIADQLKISVGRIHFAGIKDAKAVTAQHITIEGVSKEQVHKIGIRDVQLRPVGYFRSKLSSFYSLGNSFRITIKGIPFTWSVTQRRINDAIDQINLLGGIPNFFGHQRFGTARPITHLVGRSLVKSNVKKAAFLFLTKTSPYERQLSKEARKKLRKTRDFRKALTAFPHSLRYERSMLKHLVKNPDDYVGAFRRIPVKLRELFVQAYQAYLFNRFLSERIAEGMPLTSVQIGEYALHIDRLGLPMPVAKEIATPSNVKRIDGDIEAGRIRLALPLVGYAQPTSQGQQGSLERQILVAENVRLPDFRVPLLPEAAARGELRSVISVLHDFSLKQMNNDSSQASKCEVRVRFMLNRGAYATVALRELMKPRRPFSAGF